MVKSFTYRIRTSVLVIVVHTPRGLSKKVISGTDLVQFYTYLRPFWEVNVLRPLRSKIANTQGTIYENNTHTCRFLRFEYKACKMYTVREIRLTIISATYHSKDCTRDNDKVDYFQDLCHHSLTQVVAFPGNKYHNRKWILLNFKATSIREKR